MLNESYNSDDAIMLMGGRNTDLESAQQRILRSMKIDNFFFESSDIKIGWDGKVNENVVADGTYFYLVKAVGNDGINIKKQGAVTLFK